MVVRSMKKDWTSFSILNSILSKRKASFDTSFREISVCMVNYDVW